MATPKDPEMILTEEHQQALLAFEQGRNLCLLGPGGTGKSFFLRKIVQKCREARKSVLLTAPTGVAALQLPGVGKTLHSAFRLIRGYPNPDTWIKHLKQKVLRDNRKNPQPWFQAIVTAQVLVIDEISMVSGYQLHLLDIVCQGIKQDFTRPFGGLQLIVVGDFLQLPPIYKPNDVPPPPLSQQAMAFQSPVWTALQFQVILLTKSFRQADPEFAALLNMIRKNEPMFKVFREPLFQTMLQRKHSGAPGSLSTKPILYARYANWQVKQINDSYIQELKTNHTVHQTYAFPFKAPMAKSVEEMTLALDTLRDALMIEKGTSQQILYQGMRVMLTRNTATGIEPKLVNGDTGTIVGFRFPPALISSTQSDFTKEPLSRLAQSFNALHQRYGPTFAKTLFPLVKFDRLRNQQPVLITPMVWGQQEIHETSLDLVTRIEIDAIFLIPCWAITCHRLQGCTVPEGVLYDIDAGMMKNMAGAFYVAMSRCSSAEQVALSNFQGWTQNTQALAFYNGLASSAEPQPDPHVDFELPPQSNVHDLEHKSDSQHKSDMQPVLQPDPQPVLQTDLRTDSRPDPQPGPQGLAASAGPESVQVEATDWHPQQVQQWFRTQLRTQPQTTGHCDQLWHQVVFPLLSEYEHHFTKTRAPKRKYNQVLVHLREFVDQHKPDMS